MLKSIDIANYFLILIDRKVGDSITQLKLQKLMYFAQGISLALLDKPLFENEIEAWKYGPVIRELRKNFAFFGDNNLPPPLEMNFSLYEAQQKYLIYNTYLKYGGRTASSLLNETHEHIIWQDAYNNETKIITKDNMQMFFRQKIQSDFIAVSSNDAHKILEFEDEWWMHYDSGIPSEKISIDMLSKLI